MTRHPRLRTASVLMLSLLCLIALKADTCSPGPGSSLGPTAPPVFPIIIITNIWVEEGNSFHEFNLFSEDDESTSGSFEGTETTDAGDSFDITGSWSEGVVTMTIQRASAVTYRAQFTQDNPNRLVFTTSSGPDLILVR